MASWTGTRRNMAGLRAAGWGLILSPVHRFSRSKSWDEWEYGLDNGAWTAFQKKEEWSEEPFVRLVEQYAPCARFVVAPDIVAGGMDSLRRSEAWLPRLDAARIVLVPVQDGMEPRDVRSMLSNRVGIFMGGSTEWKWQRLADFAQLAREIGCYLHVGRVNTVRRIRYCTAVGAHSFDGTSATMYAVTLPKLDAARRQMALGLEMK